MCVTVYGGILCMAPLFTLSHLIIWARYVVYECVSCIICVVFTLLWFTFLCSFSSERGSHLAKYGQCVYVCIFICLHVYLVVSLCVVLVCCVCATHICRNLIQSFSIGIYMIQFVCISVRVKIQYLHHTLQVITNHQGQLYQYISKFQMYRNLRYCFAVALRVEFE